MINKRDFIPPILFKIFKRYNQSENDSIPYQVSSHLNSYSQFLEDIILYHLLKGKQSGIYVDIGANDPLHLNNTHFFYKKGWRGINIEPNPILLDKFKLIRPEDININVGVGESNGILPFYILEDDTISSFNYKFAVKNAKNFNSRIVAKKNIEILTIKSILNEYLKDNAIDFMSIDVEGYDLEVLKGNDWIKFRPKIVLVESNRQGSLIAQYMKNIDYELVYSNGCNSFFLSNEYLNNSQ